MRNALEILRQKELDLARIRREIEALRIVAPLLRDDEEALIDFTDERGDRFNLQCTGTDGFHSSASRAFAASEWEVACGQPFLVPKPTNPERGFWLSLREKKQTLLASLHEPDRQRWYGIVGAILVLVAISGYEFGRWVGHRASVGRSAAHGTKTSPRQTASTTGTSSDRTPVIGQSVEPSAQHPYVQLKSGEAERPAGLVLSENSQAFANSGPLARQTAFDTGGAELVMGRRYLQGQGVTQDHAEAARWLWKSVAKQNGDAALLLSDLFARGDGVPKSCEQAVLLLTVATAHSPNTDAKESIPSPNLCDPQ
jgi:hypothetical protein